MTDPATGPRDATRALGRELMDTLASGWSKGRVDTMLEVFSEDAVFIETPFTAPRTGIQAIREWANDIPYYQSDATFSTEFKLTFRRRTSGDWVEARGALFAETGGFRI